MVDEGPPTPTAPASRLARWSCFGIGAFLHGLGLISLIYVGGVLFLIGDPRQELVILPGVVSGAALWGLVGGGLVRHLRSPMPPAVAIATFEVACLIGVDLYFPVVTDIDLLLRSMLCTALGIPIAVATLERFLLRRDTAKTYVWGTALMVGPAVMGFSYAVLYDELGYAGFAFMVLYTEAAAALLLAFYLGLRYRTGGGPRRASGSPRASEANALEPSRAPKGPASEGTELVTSVIRAQARRLAGGSLSRWLVLAVVGAITLVLVLPSPTNAIAASDRGRTGMATTSPLTPIQHVVMIMMENHAFDSVFGSYPQLADSNRLAAGITVPSNFLSSSPPWPSSQVPNGTFTTPDPIEGYAPYHLDWDGGRMDGFSSGSGPQSLAYFDANQTAAEWDWAEEYALGDNYFASMLSESTPNRLYSLAGYSPVMNDYGPPPYVPLDQTIFGELDSYGIPWGYYLDQPSLGIGELDFIQGLSSSSPNLHTWEDFTDQLSSNSLPPVSWLEPVDGGLSSQFSQGPPGIFLQGEMWLLYFINAIMESPEWSSTAIFLTYDEGGGFYDGVAPPVVGGEQLGQRIPFLVISPYARENYVSNTLMNHGSQIAFLEYNWGLPALNAFVSESFLPLDAFDFSQSPRAPLPFKAADGFPTPSGLPQMPSIPTPASLDLGRLFPRPLQSGLPSGATGGEGASSTDLAGLGAGIFAPSDTPFTPWYLSLPFLGSVLAIEVGAWVLIPWPKVRHKPNTRPAARPPSDP